jgi:parallel beta-helix repeat protein
MHITVNTTWDMSGSPYYIEGNVMVDPGKNLTIDPGVEVLFNGSYNIYVDGDLYAVGDESNLIKFTTNVPSFTDDDRFNIQINSTGHTTLEYTNISFALYGINISQSSQNIIRNNIFTENFGGILLEKSSDNTISNNLIFNNLGIGIGINIRETFNNTIEKNNVSGSFRGINIYKSQNCTVSDNDVYESFNQGIYLFLSNANYIQYNHIFSNDHDGIEISNSDFNEIFNNNISYNGIADNDYGVELDFNSQGNLIYHNTFFFNYNQTYDDTNANNSWDNDYPQGGNYYSDYFGIDVKRGTSQDIPGSDGLGDTPYLTTQWVCGKSPDHNRS